MKRSMALISVAGIFLLGVVVGILGDHVVGARLPEGPPTHGPGMAKHFAEKLEGELGLTPEQTEQIDRILQESRGDAEAIRKEMMPLLEEHVRRTADRISEVLTPEQQEKFAALQDDHRRRARWFFLGRGGPHHGRQHGPPSGH